MNVLLQLSINYLELVHTFVLLRRDGKFYPEYILCTGLSADKAGAKTLAISIPRSEDRDYR